MAIRKIIKYPSPSLRTICQPIDFRDNWFWCAEFLENVQDLKDTLAVTAGGLALASNQIRETGFRLFVVRPVPTGEWAVGLPEVVINPKWYPSTGVATVLDEGCLSMPEVNAKVARHDAIKVEYFDIDGVECKIEVAGLDAQIVQHEIDHLDGKLIYDYLPKRLQIQTRANAIRNRRAGR
jgi:peptide deformylase